MAVRFKQVLVIIDRPMRWGKKAAQLCHASHYAVRVSASEAIENWISTGEAKIVVGVKTEQELLDLHARLLQAGVVACLVTDSGLTEFNGVPTITALGVGPNTAEILDPFTRHLKLM